MRHGFERRQSESFVQRRKQKRRGALIEDAQDVLRDEAQEAHVTAHARAHDRAAQIGLLGQRIADQQQFQLRIARVVGQFALGHGEGFDQARQILLALDVACIKNVRTGDIVPRKDRVGVGGSGLAQKQIVDGVVDYFDLALAHAEHAGKVPLRSLRDGQHAIGAGQSAAREIEAPSAHR